MSSSEPRFEVVWPLGRSEVAAATHGGRLADLDGKTIGFLWDWLFRGDEMWALLKETLRSRYPAIRFVDYELLGNTHSRDEKETLAALPQRLRRYEVDGIISGVGA